MPPQAEHPARTPPGQHGDEVTLHGMRTSTAYAPPHRNADRRSARSVLERTPLPEHVDLHSGVQITATKAASHPLHHSHPNAIGAPPCNRPDARRS